MISKKDRKTDRHTDRQTDRPTDRQTHRPTDRQTDRHTDRLTQREPTRKNVDITDLKKTKEKRTAAKCGEYFMIVDMRY